MEELQHTANATLREAMTNERSKRWHKVVHNYRRLVRMLSKNNYPPDVPLPPWHCMLMYESYYHLGIALQHLGEHKKAASQYTKAIESVFIPKNGCLAGCHANSCLMTPLYARRSLSYVKSGDCTCALRDAEKAVMLDSKNPDVYCVRSLVRSTRNEQTFALQDAKRALKYNPNHLCALIIKGCLVKPLIHDEWLEPGKKNENIDHQKACMINSDCHNFLTVHDFNHHNILAFYERFLYSLSIPHTISEIVFFIDKGHTQGRTLRISSAKCTGSRMSTINQMVPDGPGPGSQSRPSNGDASGEQEQHRLSRPFRCGTPVGITKTKEETTVQRRKEYSTALRHHISRPRTADETMAYLEKERLRRQFELARANRARQRASSATGDARPPRAKSYMATSKLAATEISPPHIPTTGPYVSKQMAVFQEMNITDMPRMYYRPWLGDKLPVANLERKQWTSPPFRV